MAPSSMAAKWQSKRTPWILVKSCVELSSPSASSLSAGPSIARFSLPRVAKKFRVGSSAGAMNRMGSFGDSLDGASTMNLLPASYTIGTASTCPDIVYLTST